MQESSDVARAVQAFYERMSAGDVDGAAATLSADPDTFAIGTQRVGAGRSEWLQSVRENAAMGVRWVTGGLRAWAVGDAGFAVDDTSAVLPDGTRLTMRMTAFLAREDDGAFRIVNMHFSWAVPDEVAMPQVGAWREQLGLVAA
jgi:ketosteroid isomerase-like protein